MLKKRAWQACDMRESGTWQDGLNRGFLETGVLEGSSDKHSEERGNDQKISAALV
jgi:hypothetical protein